MSVSWFKRLKFKGREGVDDNKRRDVAVTCRFLVSTPSPDTHYDQNCATIAFIPLWWVSMLELPFVIISLARRNYLDRHEWGTDTRSHRTLFASGQQFGRTVANCIWKQIFSRSQLCCLVWLFVVKLTCLTLLLFFNTKIQSCKWKNL